MAQNVPTTASVAASASAVTLFADLTASGRDALNRIVVNDSTATLYLKYGPSASSTDYTAPIQAGAYWEAPAPVYDGLITGIWSAANGSARCTQVEF